MKHGIAINDDSMKNYGATQVKGKAGMIDYTFTEKTGNVMFYPDDGIPYRITLNKDYVRKDDE